MSAGCPSNLILSAFLADQLDETDAQRFTQHIERCSLCQERLDELTDTPDVATFHDAWRRREGVVSTRREGSNTPCDVAPSRAISKLPAQLGRFHIQQRLGTGAFGLVYLAWDTLLKRHVALKIPHDAKLEDDERRVRFLREVEATAKLHHSNIVPLFDAGEHEGVCYLAAEYCAGGSLAEWRKLHPEPMPPRQAALIVAALADAVEHAHRRGVLHRDIKPSNVLVERIEAGESLPFTPKLTDFGLAKIIDRDAGQTIDGKLLGTPQYMAPEQADAGFGPLTPRTDVYALGVILFELAAGHRPLDSEQTSRMLQLLINQPPPPLRKVRPTVPRDLEAICAKCLEKRPERRYGSAGELAADLTRFLAGQATQARPPSLAESAWRIARRSPLLTALIATILLAMLVGVVGQTFYSQRLAAALDNVQTEQRRTKQAMEKLGQERQQVQRALQRAEAGELETRTLLYASDMREAFESWRLSNLKSAREYLAAQIPAEGRSDLRGWEWYFLHANCHPEPEFDLLHPAAVTDCLVTSDQKSLVTACEDGVIRRWHLDAGTLATEWKAHTRPARSLALSPDGQRLVSGGDDDYAYVWDVADGRQVLELGPLETGIETVAWSPCGRWIAAGARYSEFRVWSQAGELLIQQENKSRHESLVFSPDGTRLFVPTVEDIAVWNMETRSLDKRFPTYELENVRAMCLLRNGELLAMNDRFNSSIQVVNADTGEAVASLQGGVEYIQKLTPAADDQSLLAADPHGLVRRVTLEPQPDSDVSATHVVETLGAHLNVCTAACPIGDSRWATTCIDGHARVWRAEQIQQWSTFGLSAPIKGAFFYGPGQEIVTAVPNRPAQPLIFSAADSTCEPSGDVGSFIMSYEFWSMAVSGDRRWLALGGASGEVGLWDLNTHRLVRTFQTGYGVVRSVAISHDGSLLALTVESGEVFWWHSDSQWELGTPVTEQMFPTESIRVEIVDNASQLVINPDELVLLDPKRGIIDRSIAGQFTEWFDVSPDGSLVAAPTFDNRIQLWKTHTGELLFETGELTSNVRSLLFSPDGRTLLTGHADGSIRLWYMPARCSLGMLRTPSNSATNIFSLDLSPDGSRLAAVVYGSQSILLSTQTKKNGPPADGR